MQQSKEMIGHLMDTSIQTYDLLQNLLQWSRAQSRRLKNNPIPIKLLEIVENNSKLLNNNLSEKNIELMGEQYWELMRKTHNICRKVVPKTGRFMWGLCYIPTKQYGIDYEI